MVMSLRLDNTTIIIVIVIIVISDSELRCGTPAQGGYMFSWKEAGPSDWSSSSKNIKEYFFLNLTKDGYFINYLREFLSSFAK